LIGDLANRAKAVDEMLFVIKKRSDFSGAENPAIAENDAAAEDSDK